MTICSKNNCNYYVYKNSNLCSLHYKSKYFKTEFITLKKLHSIYDSEISDKLIDKKQEKNLLSLIDKLPKDDIFKIMKIIKIYLKTIDKKYITSSLALKIFSKFNSYVNNIHFIYNLVGDYWNINSNHNSVAICYYNPESVNNCNSVFLANETPKIRSPLKYKEMR